MGKSWKDKNRKDKWDRYDKNNFSKKSKKNVSFDKKQKNFDYEDYSEGY